MSKICQIAVEEVSIQVLSEKQGLYLWKRYGTRIQVCTHVALSSMGDNK